MRMELETYMPINAPDFEISVRAYNVLRAAGIMSMGALAKYSREEVLALRNCGNRTISELEDLLIWHGLAFKDEPHPAEQIEILERHVARLADGLVRRAQV